MLRLAARLTGRESNRPRCKLAVVALACRWEKPRLAMRETTNELGD